MNPLILMITIAITCSLAFVLPVGTPPNSLVYAHQGYSTGEMAKPGIIVKLAATTVMLLVTGAIALPLYGLGETHPEWLKTAVTGTTQMTC